MQNDFNNKTVQETSVIEEVIEIVIIDIEEYAKAGRPVPTKAHSYRIRIDKEKFVVKVPAMTGRELLNLAGKTPATNYMISQKFRSGEAKKIGYDEKADFTAPGVERFMTLPLDQTDGGGGQN